MSENNICKIVYEGGEGEIVEKKSRFIATVKPVDTEEEARVFDTFITTYFPSTIVFKPFMAYFFVKFFKFIRACLCSLWYNKNKKVFLCM